MNTLFLVGVVVLFGLFNCWTSRINGLFFFGRTADAELRASEAARAITRRYLLSIALATVVAAGMTWAGGHAGHRPVAATGLLSEVAACWLIFARANGQARLLGQGNAAATRDAVIQVPLLAQPAYWVPGLGAVLLPVGLCAAALGVAVLTAAHGAGLSADWSALGESMDRLGDAFLAGLASGMLTAATGILLLFRGSARLRTKMAQYTVRSSVSLEWIATALLLGVLVSNHFGVVLGRTVSRGLMAVALVAVLATFVWNQARSKQFVPPPVEVGGDDRWRWGLFYVDHGDPALFVQSRCGAGYTLNYGRMAAWPISLGLVAYVVGVLFFLPHHS
jgi:hypothetical protein